MSREHFLLIKAWGCGFWSDVNHVIGALLLAEITARMPVVHWGLNSLYRGSGEADAFRLYFEPVSRFTLDDIRDVAPIFPTARRGARDPPAYLDRPEPLAVTDFYVHLPDLLPRIPAAHPWHRLSRGAAYRAVAAKHLRPTAAVTAAIDAVTLPPSAIAVHYRGTDKGCEADELPPFEAYFAAVDRMAPGWPVFLMTDEERAVESFRARYGPRLICPEAVRSIDGRPVHLSKTTDRVQLGVEVARDVYLALGCRKFIGLGMSNPSVVISALKEWAADDCLLFGKSLLDLTRPAG
jgi:protein O-GlcNAc transferase